MFGFGGFNCGNCKWFYMMFSFKKFSCLAFVYILWFFFCSLQVDCSGCVASRGRIAPHPPHCARCHLSQVTFSLDSSKLAHAVVPDKLMTFFLFFFISRKGKNDLNKIIFKSGDLQMSPYADFPKSNRTSLEWGRETIEMQENGSTKNLLQMSDIYYSVRRSFVAYLKN